MLQDKKQVLMMRCGLSGMLDPYGPFSISGAHGARVMLMGRRSEVLDEAVSVLRSRGIYAHKVVGDVRDPATCESAVRETLRVIGGRLDILVNSAAGNFLCMAKDLSPKGFKTGMNEQFTCVYTHVVEV